MSSPRFIGSLLGGSPRAKRDIIAKLLQADPTKSDRQIAETVKASPTTVGKERAKLEAKGDVSKLDTRRDTKGRKQLAKKNTDSRLDLPLFLDRRLSPEEREAAWQQIRARRARVS